MRLIKINHIRFVIAKTTDITCSARILDNKINSFGNFFNKRRSKFQKYNKG